MSLPAPLAFVVKEFKEMLPPTIFFAVGFNLILLTTNLLLSDYRLQLAGFLVATTSALVVGKAVPVANALPFLRRFDNAPLIQPVLFKTGLYFAVVFAVRFLEKLIEFFTHGGALSDLPAYVADHFTWHRFIAIQLWILVLFLIYTFISELNALFGDGEMSRILFTWRSTELKQTRRQRIRTLRTLSRLAEAHTTGELADPATAAHRQMMRLIGSLAQNQGSRASPVPAQRPAEPVHSA